MRTLITALVVAAALCASQAFAQAQGQWRNSNPIVQASEWVAVTKSDSADQPTGVCKGLWVDGAGNVSFIPAGNADASPITITVAAGTRIDGFVRRVRNTSTTATGIYCLY